MASKQPTTSGNAATQTAPDTIHARIRRARAAIGGLITQDKKAKIATTKGEGRGFEYGYVSHQRLLAAVDPALEAEGLWHSQSIRPLEGVLIVETRIIADDGAFYASEYVVPYGDRGYKDFGASQSYGRRLGLMAALGLRDGSDEQASSYERDANASKRRDQKATDATADEREDRIARLRAACEATELDRDGLLRAIHDATDSDRLKQWIAGGRDPLDLTAQGWGVLLEALDAVENPGIEGDLPL